MMKKVLALLLAVGMLLTLCSCGKEANTNTSSIVPDDVAQTAEAFIKAYYMRDYLTQFSLCFHDARRQWEDKAITDLGSEQNFLALAQKQANEKGIDVRVDSFETYYTSYREFMIADVAETYGEYTLTVTCSGGTKMDDAQLTQFCDGLLSGAAKDYVNAGDLKAVTDAYTVSVNIVIDGEKRDYNETYFVYLVNHQGNWLVADHTS